MYTFTPCLGKSALARRKTGIERVGVFARVYI